MKTKTKQNLYLGMIVLMLVTLACGSVQVGVVSPTDESSVDLVHEIQDQESDLSENPRQALADEETPEQVVEEVAGLSDDIDVVAWLGHIVSFPESSQYDDFVVLSPQGTGEFGLAGATPEIEAEIRNLRDASGPEEFVHLWGTLSCNIEDYNNCQLVVDRLQYGAKNSEEEIEGWVGTIYGSLFNGGSTYVFQLSGDYPMWYSIYASQDEDLKTEIESLRDTGAVIRVEGRLLVGIPDVNGTRIEVSSLEVIEEGTKIQDPYPIDTGGLTADWPVFINDRYGYQVKYPEEATISLFGPVSFPSDELPADTTADQYMSELTKLYTDRLCVRIEYSLGWIYIAAPENEGGRYTPCGPTGVGSGEIIPKIEVVSIGNQPYQANGHEVKIFLNDGSDGTITGETLDLHYESFMVELEDGTRIRWGSTPNHEATYDDFLMKTKGMLIQILATYESLP